MSRQFKKSISIVLLICFISMSGFYQNVSAADSTGSGTLSAQESANPGLSQSQLELGENWITDSTDSTEITSSNGHAYEPFKENSNQKDLKGLSYRKDRVLVKMSSTYLKSKPMLPGSNPLKSHGITAMEKMFTGKIKNQSGVQGTPGLSSMADQWYKATVKSDTDIQKVIEELSNVSGVISVEPDYIRSLSDIEIPEVDTDPDNAKQWYLEKLGIKQAWHYLESQGINPGGSRDIVVAVIDTGVDYNHSDLAGNMWTNSREIPWNNYDDDGNGFVDDIHGANMVGNVYAGESGNPLDDNGHGTHVAGIIAAQSKNGVGGVGIAHNVQIMAVKAAQSSGILSSSDIAQAIYYAAANGADVINMSFGGYGQSTVEEDALQTAFGTSVLVAAAGNDGKPNLPHPKGADMFPAAYPWVMGVMAENQSSNKFGDYLAGFSNWDFKAQDSHEYEVMAPGVDIYSTLPGNKYAKWSGTSMAAPVVSGIAALVRSKFSDKDMYSTRFILGQLATTGELKQGITYDPKSLPLSYYEVNAFNALTSMPKPNLSYLEHYIFDSTSISPNNNGDGVVDAGEVIDLAMIIRNQWGKAQNVQVTIDTKSGVGIEDPYITFLDGTDIVDYGAVGTFDTDDNGLIYKDDVAVGVNHPFKIKIADNTPNDHVVPIHITMTATNGFDTEDTTVYTFGSDFSFAVRNGQKLPGVITSDMNLTSDKYWIVPNATIIERGAKVTVEPGTQIQFWSSEPEDPYAQTPMAYIQVKGKFIVNGTADNPVEMFPSSLYRGFEVKLYSTKKLDGDGRDQYEDYGYAGYAELNYAKIYNPSISVNKVDHCYFSQMLNNDFFKRDLVNGSINTADYYGPVVNSLSISNSIFYKLGTTKYDPYSLLNIKGESNGNLFDSCAYLLDEKRAENNTYLKNYKLMGQMYGDREYLMSRAKGFAYSLQMDSKKGFTTVFPTEYKGKTYAALKMDFDMTDYMPFTDVNKLAEYYANQLGGHIVTINSEEENAFLYDYIQNKLHNQELFNSTYPGISYDKFAYQPVIGINDLEIEGEYNWESGETSTYRNWDVNQPSNYNNYYDIAILNYNGKWISSEGWYLRTNPFIIELPGSVVQEQLDNVKVETVKNNAILNRWWDPNINRWMKFTSEQREGYVRYLSGNYWGTTSEFLIGKSIIDFNDYRSMEEVIFSPILTEAPETAYPFVTDIYISTESEERTTKVGAEKITVHAKFNRDMNTNIQPQVSFGPDMPTTDYTVHGVNGGWAGSREWVGEFNITPITGDGYQFFRVAGAVAADDPWLVTGNDSERFRFEIITSGTESMNLQATGAEGKVILSWTQDDFDLLAGYNIYRAEFISDRPEGWVKVNPVMIPKDQKTYEDTNVQPGKTYYYRFTVVKTDLTESDYSNVAAAAPYDTVPPVIDHDPITSASVGLPLTIYADVTDNVMVDGAALYYRKTGTAAYFKKEMIRTTENRFTASLEGSLVQAPGLEYYIEATDGISLATSGTSDIPNKVAVTDAPKITSVTPNEGPQGGGSNVIIIGTNFKEGASVAFGGALASNVNVESSSKITCTTPSNYPSTVDVTVTNPDGYKDTILRAFTYKIEGVQINIPSVKANKGQLLEVPVNVSGVTGLMAADLRITYDKDVLSAKRVRIGTIAPKFSLSTNINNPGEIIVSMASGMEVAGSGALIYLQFEVLNTDKATSPITLDTVELNSGSITVNKVDGLFTVSAVHTVSGSIYYYKDSRLVNEVELDLSGIKSYRGTSTNGQYAINSVEEGDYVLKASKSNESTDISSMDASLILQSAVGILSLNDYQKIAADVDGNGKINSMDAAYVLRRSAGLLNLPFPGAGKVWTFIPGEVRLNSLQNDYYQGFTAILIGDVTGNWNSGIANSPAKTNAYAPAANTGSAVLWLDNFINEGYGYYSVPVMINPDHQKLFAVDMVIRYNSESMDEVTVEDTDLSTGFSFVPNYNVPGEIRIAMAGSEPIEESGNLLNIKFKLKNGSAVPQPAISSASLNEDEIASVIEAPPLVWSTMLTGSEKIDIDQPVKVVFDKDILEGKNYSGIALTNMNGIKIETSKEIEGNTLVITPSRPLARATNYKVDIPAAAVKSIEGMEFKRDYLYYVTTNGVYKPVIGMYLKDTLIKLGLNQTFTFECIIKPGDATNTEILWTSSNRDVVMIGDNGKAVAVGHGSAVITATTVDGGFTATAKVEVIPVTKVTISKTALSMKPGAKAALTATVAPGTAVNKNILWKSSNEAVAKVDSKGNITAAGIGEAVIMAVAEDNEKIMGRCVVTVEIPVTSIKLRQTKVSISTTEGNNKAELGYLTAPDNATNKGVKWSSSNEAVATIDENGIVQGISAGTATITATTLSGEKTAKCTVTVAPVVGITFSKTSISMTLGSSTVLVPVINPKTAAVKDLIWTVEEGNSVVVTKYGKVMTVKAGVSKVRVTTRDGGYNALCTITVTGENKIPAASISLTNVKTGKNVGMILVGKTASVKAVLTGVGSKTPTNKNILWISSDDSIAAVDDSGKITAKAPGKVVITAIALGGNDKEGKFIQGTVNIEVVQPAASVALSKFFSADINETADIAAVVLPKDVTTEGIKIVWSKSDRSTCIEFIETNFLCKDEFGNLVSNGLDRNGEGIPYTQLRFKALKAGTATLTLIITTKDGSYKKVTSTIVVK